MVFVTEAAAKSVCPPGRKKPRSLKSLKGQPLPSVCHRLLKGVWARSRHF